MSITLNADFEFDPWFVAFYTFSHSLANGAMNLGSESLAQKVAEEKR
jgi:hypothetical protein